MYDAVVEFGEFCTVPSVGSADEISCDTLEFIDVMTAAFWAGVEFFVCILIAAIHAAVAIVVDRAIADVVFVHKIHNVGDRFGLWVASPSIFDIEYMASSGKFVIWSLDAGLMARRAVIVDRHMVGVGVIYLICYAGNDAE